MLLTHKQKHEAKYSPVDISVRSFHTTMACELVLATYTRNVKCANSLCNCRQQLLQGNKPAVVISQVSDREIGKETCGNTC